MFRRVAVALAVSLAACGSTVSDAQRQVANQRTGGSETESSLGVSDTTAPDGSAAGATGSRSATTSVRSAGAATAAPRGPITIGIVRTAVSNAAAFGASLGNTVSEADVYDALIGAVNDGGGIAGRRIVPVYDETDTASQSWDADFEAVCAKFTQDNRVVAVLGYVFDYVQSFESCLSKRGIPHLSTSFNIPDAEELRQFPLLMALSTPRIERRSRLKIDGAMAAGVLTTANRVAVLLDSCPGTERAWSRSTAPYMKSKGIQVVSTFSLGCPRGVSEASGAAAQAGNFILRARSAGADTMMFNAVSEGPALLILSALAEAQGWRPKYIVSSLANGAVIGGQIPAPQAANVHGFGWLPVQDVSPGRWPPLNAAQTRCGALAQSKRIALQSASDHSFAFNLCEALFVYERALQATGGRTDGALVAAAIERLGTSHMSALNLDGRSAFAPTQHDGPAVARYFAFNGDCRCFTYRPLTVPIR